MVNPDRKSRQRGVWVGKAKKDLEILSKGNSEGLKAFLQPVSRERGAWNASDQRVVGWTPRPAYSDSPEFCSCWRQDRETFCSSPVSSYCRSFMGSTELAALVGQWEGKLPSTQSEWRRGSHWSVLQSYYNRLPENIPTALQRNKWCLRLCSLLCLSWGASDQNFRHENYLCITYISIIIATETEFSSFRLA